MTKNNKKFDTAVSTIRSAIMRRVRSQGTVSSADIVSVARTLNGPERGAAVSTVFSQLVREDILRPTKKTVVNPETRHRVTVYDRV